MSSGQPHLLERIERMLVDSLAGYMRPARRRPYVRAPALGADAGPLGAIALAMTRSALAPISSRVPPVVFERRRRAPSSRQSPAGRVVAARTSPSSGMTQRCRSCQRIRRRVRPA